MLLVPRMYRHVVTLNNIYKKITSDTMLPFGAIDRSVTRP